MVKISSKNTSWQCKKGCKVTKNPCPHLEALLPHPERAIKLRYRESMDIYSQAQAFIPLQDSSENMDKIVKVLKKFKLPELSIKMFIDKTIMNMSLRNIAKEYNTNVSTVFLVITNTIKELKSKGISLKDFK